MIEIATAISAVLQPLAVPLQVWILLWLWRVDRRLLRVEIIVERELVRSHRRRKGDVKVNAL